MWLIIIVSVKEMLNPCSSKIKAAEMLFFVSFCESTFNGQKKQQNKLDFKSKLKSLS